MTAAAALVWAAGCGPPLRINPVSGLSDWENERIFERNRLAAPATFTSCPTEAMAFRCEPEDFPYRPVSPKKPAQIDLRLIPCYAWGNRGKTEMSVWLPVR